MKSAIILTLLMLGSAFATEAPMDPTKWVPSVYTQLLNDSSLGDWTWGYKIGPENKYGFVGDTCGEYSVFGANVAGKNTPITTDVYLDGPIYSYIIETTVWMIDSYDYEHLVGKVNGEEVFSYDKGYDHGPDLCGNVHHNNYGDLHKKVILENPLSADTFEFELTSNLDENAINESIGLSEFRLWVAYCHPACASCEGQGNGKCIECTEGYQKDDYGACIPSEMGLTLSIDDPIDFANKGDFYIGGALFEEGQDFPGETCDEQTVFGVGNASNMIEANFKPNPRATKCAVQFDIFFADSWDQESLNVTFQGSSIAHFAYDENEEGQLENLCGRDYWQDRHYRVLSPMFPYEEGQDLNLVVTSTLDQSADDESFGIANLKLFCEICHPSCTDCRKPNDKYACTSCPEGQLLHVPRGSDEGECLNPTGACFQGFLREHDNVCLFECPAESDEAAEGITFLHNQQPIITSEIKRDFVKVNFKTELPRVCYRGHLDIVAAWEEDFLEVETHMTAIDDMMWQTEVYLMDRQLNDPEVCTFHRDDAMDSTYYDCELKFIGLFRGEEVESWTVGLNIEVIDDVPVHSGIYTYEDNDSA